MSGENLPIPKNYSIVDTVKGEGHCRNDRRSDGFVIDLNKYYELINSILNNLLLE